MTEDQLQTDVEIKLRKAGIPVLTEAAWLSEPGKPFLYIEVKAYSPIEASYMFATTVQLEQEVTLIRSRPQQRHRVFGATWKDRGIGTVDSKNIRTIREHVGDSVDKFINGYLAANPRQ